MDLPYILLILILLFLSFLEWRNPGHSTRYFKCASAVVFIFVAFRAPVVGADTWNYYNFAMGMTDSYLDYNSTTMEPLYLMYSNIYRNIIPIGILFMVVNTIIIFSPLYYLLNRYVKFKTFGVLSFFLFSNYGIFFVALRQIISLSVLLWAIIFVIESDKKYKWIVYIILTYIAYLFHITSIVVSAIFIIAYIIQIRNRIIPIATLIATFIISIILQKFNILDIFNYLSTVDFDATSRVNEYYDYDLEEYSEFNIFISTSLLSIYTYLFLPKEKLNGWFSKIYLLGISLYTLFYSVPMITRMVISQTIFIIVLIPYTIETLKNLEGAKRTVVKCIFFLLILYFTRAYIINNSDYDINDSGRMHPYYFVFEDYYNHPSITKF